MLSMHFKKKLESLDQTLTHLDDTGRLSFAWYQCNNMAMAWMTNYIEDNVAKSMIWIDTTHEIWVTS